jgi:DNA polymerase I
MKQPTTIILDGDVLVYKAALGAQESLNWGQDVYTYTADMRQAVAALDADIKQLMARLNARKVKVVLSDPRANWRKAVLPAYKYARGDKAKPILFHQLREHLAQAWGAEWLPSLEGDDLLGMYGTGTLVKGRRVIVSIDKDLQQIPGLLYNPGKPERGVVTVTLPEADRYHLVQTLTGDPTDGYKGLPGCGPKCAGKILDPFGPLDTQSLQQSAWAAVEEAFVKGGLSAEEALVQARVARILRAGEYSRADGKVKLWEPERICQ